MRVIENTAVNSFELVSFTNASKMVCLQDKYHYTKLQCIMKSIIPMALLFIMPSIMALWVFWILPALVGGNQTLPPPDTSEMGGPKTSDNGWHRGLMRQTFHMFTEL
jgi:hypothetical protein